MGTVGTPGREVPDAPGPVEKRLDAGSSCELGMRHQRERRPLHDAGGRERDVVEGSAELSRRGAIRRIRLSDAERGGERTGIEGATNRVDGPPLPEGSRMTPEAIQEFAKENLR